MAEVERKVREHYDLQDVPLDETPKAAAEEEKS